MAAWQRRTLPAHHPSPWRSAPPRHLDGGPLRQPRRREELRGRECGVGAGFQPDRFPEFGQCVHKIAAHPDRPERLYMQNHGGFEDDPTLGVLRSDDGGRSWKSIAKGLPSDFGFPIAVHPHDPDTVYVVPLEPATRTCPGSRPAVWRSENAGEKWHKLTDGLPKKDAWFTVLRDAMDIDDGRRPSVWFGTTTGQLWRGRDGGESFECVERVAAADQLRESCGRLIAASHATGAARV